METIIAVVFVLAVIALAARFLASIIVHAVLWIWALCQVVAAVYDRLRR